MNAAQPSKSCGWVGRSSKRGVSSSSVARCMRASCARCSRQSIQQAELLKDELRSTALTAALAADIVAPSQSRKGFSSMDFVYFLGRFHVLVLHLPIGM